MLKKHFTCFIRWVLQWIRLEKLFLLAGKLFPTLSRPQRSALHKLASRFSIAKSPCGLTTLPQEILEIILSELGWEDVINVRATCKSLCATTRSRPVWCAQYQRVSDSYDTPLDAKDDTATYAELERDTLHWARLQHNWVSQPKQPTQRLVCECSAVQIHLVPGGRWLLATGDSPCLELYDLDSPNGQRRILIRPQDKRAEEEATIAIDEANTTPSNVDMFIALNHETTYEPFVRLSIWRITSAPNDSLTAHHITSFNTRATGLFVQIDLRGDYFARCAPVYLADGRSSDCIDIYDWRRSSSLVHHKATIVIGEEAIRVIRILPGQRILTFGEEVVKIYAIDASEFRPTSGKRAASGPPAMPLHTLNLLGMNPYLASPLHIDLLSSASLYLPCAHAVVKLIIHYDSRPPTAVGYLTCNGGDTRVRALTPHRAYLCSGTTVTAVLLAHERLNQVCRVARHSYSSLLVDDYSGRVVERARMNFALVVLLLDPSIRHWN